jgi:endo-1,4-beta-xylanase
MFAKHPWSIGVGVGVGVGVVGLALCACGDDGKIVAIVDAPQVGVEIDAPLTPDAAPPKDGPAPMHDARAPEPDAAVPVPDAPTIPDAPVGPVNLVPNPGGEQDAVGWTNNGGGATVSRTLVVAHTGVASLMVTNRSGNWNGPAVDLTASVERGKSYTAMIWIRQVAPATTSYFLSTRPNCMGEAMPRFNEMTTRTPAMATTDTDWVLAQSKFTVNNDNMCNLTSFEVYVETSADMANFYLDDTSVTEVPPATP